ncbi:MAG: putative sigma regulatory protein MucB/RseB, partial [Blastococcus sp.]|nr:putative sigma regulatory protein MucB/RseB [Blastococcus sp.]
VDVWVDGDSGLPLQVEIVAKGADRPALDSRFLELDLETPGAQLTAFRPPPGATVREGTQAEVILEAGRRGVRRVSLPPALAGLPRRELAGAPSGIGLYGSGVTLLAVAPVPARLADALRSTLAQSPEAVVDAIGTRVAAGPVALMLVEPPGGAPYVLTGTVTLDALATAAAQLPDLGATP